MSQDAFFAAVLAGDSATLRALASQNPSLVHARNDENRTALHVALECNNTVCDLLIELGAPIDISAAAALGRLDELEALLAADASRANDCTTGLTPLGWASYFCSTESGRMLLAHGADANDGSLLCAAMVNCVAMGRLLLAAGADPEAIHPRFESNALHAAATLRHTRDATPFVEMLLEHGVDVNARTPRGLTALDLNDRMHARRIDDGTIEHHDHDAMERLLESRGGSRSQVG